VKKSANDLRQAVASLEEIADDIMENDVHTGINLRRIAFKVLEAVSSNDALIENLDVEDNIKDKIASFVKEAVKVSKKKTKIN
jgi:hypothetical protein